MESFLRELARRYIWWQDPDVAAADQDRLLCQLMQLGTWEDVRAAKHVLGAEAFRAALQAAPPGVLDERSWNFWHRNLFGRPAPAQPARPFPR